MYWNQLESLDSSSLKFHPFGAKLSQKQNMSVTIRNNQIP
jgi:hypothetical protein